MSYYSVITNLTLDRVSLKVLRGPAHAKVGIGGIIYFCTESYLSTTIFLIIIWRNIPEALGVDANAMPTS